jgi:hypothetical protein
MVARKTNGNGKTMTSAELTEPLEKAVEALEKEHLGDIDLKTGIYYVEPTLEEREKMLDQLVQESQEMGFYDNPSSTIEVVGEKTPMMLLVTALAKARAEFDAVTKNAANPFFKSKYADLSEVIGAITPALSANGLVVVQPIEQTEQGLLLRTQLYHVGGGVIESTFAIPENKDIQKLGSSITYIRRYSLSSLFGVAPEDDDGNAAAGKQVNVEATIEQCANYFVKFEQCETLNDLKTLWADLNKTNPMVAKSLTKIKDLRKDKLMEIETASKE